MKRLILLFPAILLSVCAFAQTDLADLRSKLQDNRIELNYNYTIASNTDIKVTGSGHLILDGKRYKSEGNGLRFICDGSTLWTVDEAAKEVYVENRQGADEFLTDISTGKSRIAEFKMEADRASGKYTQPGSGNTLDFQLREIKISKPGINVEEFRLDISKLDKTWIITDLR